MSVVYIYAKVPHNSEYLPLPVNLTTVWETL